MSEKERCPTGIKGLDERMGGGLPPGPRTVLVSGGCGTGKTTFGVQFLCKGITENNEPGILINFEQNIDQLKSDMLDFGFDLHKLEQEGSIRIYDKSSVDEGKRDLVTFIIKKAQEIGAKRIVIDSMQTLEYMLGTDIKFTLSSTCDALKRAKLTTLIIAESGPSDLDISEQIESYIVDGVLLLSIHEALDSRKIRIRKMRGTKHTLKPLEMRIGENGIEIVD